MITNKATYRGRHPADPTGKMYGNRHQPFPQHYDGEPPMMIVINREDMHFVCSGEYRTAWAFARKKAAAEILVIGDALSGRTYSPFTEMELKMLRKNATGELSTGMSYETLLQACKEIGLKVSPLTTPKLPMWRPPVVTPKKVVVIKAASVPSSRPGNGTLTGQVWEIADGVQSAAPGLDEKTMRGTIITACVQAGISIATAQTQFSKWKKGK